MGHVQLPPEAFDRVKTAYERTDAYQPVYGLETALGSNPMQRACVDRCELIAGALGADIPGLRILDVGCSMGYISLYFAERRGEVTGVDYNSNNTEFCRTLSSALGIEATFVDGMFCQRFVDDIQEDEFDAVLLLSVLHHVISDFGIDDARRLVDELLRKVDSVFVELAQKSEDFGFAWHDALPSDDLDLFAGIEDIKVERLGKSPALGETVVRPLYKVSKTAKRINGIEHRNIEIRRSEIMRGGRKYYVSDALFTKCFILTRQFPDSYHRFVSEAAAYARIGPHPHFLPLVGTEIRGRGGYLTLPKIDGQRLMEVILSGPVPDLRRTALAIRDVLKAFARAGLYWNDFRTHNLAFFDGRLVAMDFEATHALELENTLSLFLWTLAEVQSGRLMLHHSAAFQDAARKGGNLHLAPPPWKAEDYADEIRDLASAALNATGIRDFLARVDLRS